MVKDISSTVTFIKKEFQKHETSTVHTMEKLMLEMETGFQFLNLTDEQEEFFMNLIKTSMQKRVAIYREAKAIGDQLGGVYTKLTEAMKED
ncbi:MAG: hypothetical protein GY694_06040 [Gammaproteobacteria bacterium]|nr:hypothetical protein [Gammaproteobacteria bacterium]